jgi:hypothetical protein
VPRFGFLRALVAERGPLGVEDIKASGDAEHVEDVAREPVSKEHDEPAVHLVRGVLGQQDTD